LPSCTWAGSVFFSVGLGRTAFARDTDFASLMKKPARALYLPNDRGHNFATTAAFYKAAPLTARRTFQLWYHQEAIVASSFQASALVADPGADCIRIAKQGTVRQILTDDRFADIQPLADVRTALPDDIKDVAVIPANAPGFVVRTWFAGSQGALQTTGQDIGLYVLPSGDPLGYVVFYQISLDTNGGELGIILRSKVNATIDKTESWVHLQDGGSWTSTHYKGLPTDNIKLEETTRVPDATNPLIQSHVVKQASMDPTTGAYGSLHIISSDEEEFADVGGLKRLVRSTSGSNLAENYRRTTRYGWVNTTTNAATHGLLKWVHRPDGSFEYMAYNITTLGTSGSIVTHRPWKDTTWTYGDTAPVDAGCIVETTTFTSSSLITEQKVDGTSLISRVTEGWSTSNGNLVHTRTMKYGAGAGDVLTTTTGYSSTDGRIAWRDLPDGTTESYTYGSRDSSGNYTQTIKKGAIDHAGSGSGMAVTSTRNKQGFTYTETQSHFHGSTSVDMSSWAADSVASLTAQDFFGRVQGKIYYSKPDSLSVGYEAVMYGCCGIAYTQDRQGKITEYSQDYLKRVYKTIETSGNATVTTTTAYGVDGTNLVTETRRAGSPGLLVEKTWRHTTGEIDKIWSPDQDGGGVAEETTYSYDFTGGGHKVTVTRPDSSTDVTDYYVDGRIKSAGGTAVPDVTYEYSPHSTGGGGIVTKATNLILNGTWQTTEWVETHRDLAGRVFQVVYPTDLHTPGTPNTPDRSSTTYYLATADAGSIGKIESTTDPDGVIVTYEYDAEGERSTVTQTMPGTAGTRETTFAHEAANVTDIGNSMVETTKVNNVEVSKTIRSGDGTTTRQIENQIRTTTTVRSVPSAGGWTETTTNPDDTRTTRAFVDGRLDTVAQRDNTNANSGLGGVVSSTTYSYDTYGRLTSTTDLRTGSTSYTSLTESGNILSMTAPGSRVTAFSYDAMGRRTVVDAPNTNNNSLANITRTSYWPTGQVKAVWGDQTYATVRLYDEQNRMTKLLTFRTWTHTNGATGPDENTTGDDMTSWIYDPSRGWLSSKRDDADKGADYTYYASGRLASRQWARFLPGTSTTRVLTEYGYDQGMLTSVTYNDSLTPDVDYIYDSFGRVRTVTQGSGGSSNTHTFAYMDDIDDDNDPQTENDPTFGAGLGLYSETVSYGGPGLTRTLLRHEDSILRPSGWELKAASSTVHATSYGYDTAGRLKYVHPAAALPATPADSDFTYQYQPNSYNLPQTVAGPAHTVTNTWETTLDVLDTKINVTTSNTPSSFDYTVNPLGQRDAVGPVISGGNPVSTYTPKWAWAYNDRGELVTADHGADATANTHDRFYKYDAIGNRDYVRSGVFSDAGGTLKDYTANALNQYTKANDVVLPTTPVPAPYDLDGNLRFDGGVNKDSQAREYVWDGENRLIEVMNVSVSPAVSLVSYKYDHLSRLIARTDSAATTHYLYDGWNRIAEYSGQDLKMSYTWGMDLSGSMQGAGGVGGLLAVSEHSGTAQNPVRTPFYPTFDGNGNVSEYLNGNGVVQAHYEYDAFGNTVISSGAKVADFRHRFSTKPLDLQTGLYYYGYRYYDPLTGRWPSLDPIGESGGSNLYGFVGNNGVDRWDHLGLVISAKDINDGDSCSIFCETCDSDGQLKIKDNGTSGYNVKAIAYGRSLKVRYNKVAPKGCKDECCASSWFWRECYNRQCNEKAGSEFNEIIKPIQPPNKGPSEGGVRALSLIILKQKVCRCENGTWKCWTSDCSTNQIMYEFVDPQDATKGWKKSLP
jgi:RHS repeat-associated protein